MISWNEIASTIGLTAVTAGAVLAAAWALIKSALEKRIEESVKHGYAVILEQQKAQHAIMLEQQKAEHGITLEKQKAQQAIISKNIELLWDSCNQLGQMIDELIENLATFEQGGGAGYADRLVHDFHPKFKRRYESLRARFEVNDVFSAYSLMLDRLLHSKNVAEIINSLNKKSRGNVRFIYSKMWLTVAEISRSIYKTSQEHEFWNPKKNYGERADRWAEHDFQRINKFLKSVARDRGSVPEGERDYRPFYISLEEEDGKLRFWNELPAELPPRAKPTPALPASLAIENEG